jgi:phosphopantothenoylcysteine decarboxylase/phosphopantothenate--cysteine ligase
MGFAIAEEAASRGAAVTLISGPVNVTPGISSIRIEPVISADDMYRACKKHFPSADILIMAAAVADYTPVTVSPVKIKKTSRKTSIDLEKTRDILEELGSAKKKNQIIIGFALESGDGIRNAKEKLSKKNLDLIILNSLDEKGTGFKVPTNKVTIISRSVKILQGTLKDKRAVASDILDAVKSLMNRRKAV